jgi:hypothetical protein
MTLARSSPLLQDENSRRGTAKDRLEAVPIAPELQLQQPAAQIICDAHT